MSSSQSQFIVMHAPRQYSLEKKPQPKTLAPAEPELNGPVMAPPAYTALSEQAESVGAETVQRKESSGSQELGRSEAPPQFKLIAGSPFQFKFSQAPLQMKAGNATGGGSGVAGGLPDAVKNQMEGAFGTSFDDVKVNANSSKASEVGALAYAQGNEIHFAPGQYSPESKGGQELLGHELAHVVQQREGRVQANAEINGMAVNNQHHLENEADQLGAKAAAFTGGGGAVAKSAGGAGSSGPVQAKMDTKSKGAGDKKGADDKKKNKTGRQIHLNPDLRNASDGFGNGEGPDQLSPIYLNPDQRNALDGFADPEAEAKDNKLHLNPDLRNARDGFAEVIDEKEEGKEGKGKDAKAGGDAEGASSTPGDGGGAEAAGPEGAEAAEGEHELEEENAEQEAETESPEADQAAAEEDAPAAETQDPEASASEDGAEGEDKKKDGKKADGKGEGADGGGEGNGGDAAAAAGGGAAGAGGGAGNAGGKGAVGGKGAAGGKGKAGGMEPIEVAPEQRGNFGEGDEPAMMIVNEAALAEFDPGQILKKESDGSAIVLSGNIPASLGTGSDQPIQRKPDPKKKAPVKKPVPKSKSKEMMAANREKAKAYLAEFEAASKSQIASVEAAKGGIAAQIQAGASEAKSAIQSAAASEKARVQAGFAAQKAALRADAARLKAAASAAAESAKSAVMASAETAKGKVEAGFQTQNEVLTALEPAMKAEFTKVFTKAREDMMKDAKEIGEKGKERGKALAAQYDQEPTPEQSTAQDILNGGDYEKNRHKAKVEAAIATGNGFAEGLIKSATEEADKLQQGGESQSHAHVTNSIQQSRQIILQSKTSALQTISTQSQGAITSISSQYTAAAAGMDAAATAGISQLDAQQSQALQAIDQTANTRLGAVDATAQEKIQNIESQVQSAIDALNSQVNRTISGVTSRKNPAAETVRHQLHAAQASIERAAADGAGLATEGASASAQGMLEMATKTAAELKHTAASQIDSAKAAKEGISKGIEAQKDSFETAAKGLQESANTTMTESATNSVKEMKTQADTVKSDLDIGVKNLTSKLGENSAQFKGNLEQQLAGLDAMILEKAQAAKDAVRSRWVSWLLTAIDILVVIVVTAVICVAIASGVGIIGVLLIGAAAGAVGGMIKYGAEVGLTSKEASWGGLANAALGGAVDGVNIAATCLGFGALATIGIGAAGGAVKYLGNVFLEGSEKFSIGGLLGNSVLGGLGAGLGLISGKAGDKVAGWLTKEVGGKVVESLGRKIFKDLAKNVVEAGIDTFAGGIQAMGDHFVKTGSIDITKLTDELTIAKFTENIVTNKVTDSANAHVKAKIDANPNFPKTSDGVLKPTTTPDPTTTTPKDNTESTTPKDNVETTTPKDNADANKTNDTPVNKDNSTETPKTNDPNTKPKDAPITADGKVNPDTVKKDAADNTTKDTDAPTNKPDADASKPTHKGQQQADALGYPKAPDGYKWIATAKGEPYLRRDTGRKTDLPPVKFDADTHQFKPDIPAPDGYHWKMDGGKFTLSPNKNLADSLPPISYDPKTGGFKDADGKPFTGDVSAHAVRGTDFDGFTKSVDGLGADPITAKQAYDMFAKKDWPALEKLFKEKGLNGGWPPNRGFINVKDGVLAAGSQFDRFGGYTDSKTGEFKDSGQFVANYGDNFPGRALPQSYIDGDGSGGGKKPLNGYIVLKDIPVKTGEAIPWFGQPGGNPQHELPKGGIDKLIADGYIKKIDAPDLNAPKTDGSVKPDVDGNDGGGMKSKTTDGKDIYAPTPGEQRIRDLKPAGKESNAKEKSQLRDAFVNAASGQKIRHDATIVKAPGTTSTVTMKVQGIEATIVIRNTKNSDFSKANTDHGSQQGPARCEVKWVVDAATGKGKWEATIHLNENYAVADLNKMAAHELSEVADIIVKENKAIESGKHNDSNGNLDPTKLSTSIGDQQKSSVFKEGVNPAHVDVKNMTAHDHATVKELDIVMRELQKDLTTPGSDPAKNKERVRLLLDTMGIKYTGDPGFKLLADKLGMKIPADVQAWMSTHVGKNADQQMIMDNFHQHVNVAKLSGTTMDGGHNEVAMLAEVSSKPGKIHLDPPAPSPNGTPGVKVYQYFPIDAATGAPDRTKGKTKTTFDPSVWPPSRLIQSATEAFASKRFLNDAVLGDYWQGVDANGVTIRGLYKGTSPNVTITTFWPE
jgi:hypothetical protein